METQEPYSDEQIPDAQLKPKGKGISAVWVIPVIAALIGGWLVFKNVTREEVIVEVAFKNAAGLEAGKTAVKLRNIKIGEVKDVKFSPDLTEVIAIIEFKEGVKQERITDVTRFWVVKPRIGGGSISGLETLVSGAYIEVDPGKGGVPETKFTGLEQPQIHQLEKGSRFILTADKLGSLTVGAPVKYRDITVGRVTQFDLQEEHNQVTVQIFVRAPHDQHVKETTRFWDISGLSVDVSTEGIKFHLDSVSSLISGGIAFFTEGEREQGQAKENTVFKLHTTEQSLIEDTLIYGAPMKLYFEKGVNGLSVNAPVEYKGMRIGTVRKISSEADRKNIDMNVYAIIDIEPGRLPISEIRKFKSNKERTHAIYNFFEKMVNRGLRAQLKTSNLVTGKSLVTLDFFPDGKKMEIKYVGGVAILPTVPETFTSIVDKANVILGKLQSMPIEEIAGNLEETSANLNMLIKSFDADKDGMMGLQIRDALEELTRSARSIRSMSEYLERHPEALLKGKQQ
jgi:paraquat-inducible protein B